MTVSDDSQTAGWGPRAAILLGLAATAALFGIGVLVGLGAAIAEHGVRNPVKVGLAAVIATVLIVGSAVAAARLVRRLRSEPVSPRVKTARRMLNAATLLGVVLGVVGSILALTGSGDAWGSVDGPVPPWFAILSVALYAVGGTWASIVWWRSIDEHEKLATRDAAVWSLGAYMVVAPCWWMLHRASLAPQPNEIVTFVAITLLFTVLWLRGRYS